MAASFALHPDSAPARHSGPPTLRLVQGGRSSASGQSTPRDRAARPDRSVTPHAVYMVRRLGVALVAAMLVAMLVVAVLGLLGDSAGSQAVPGAAAATGQIVDRYEVAPGDTLWSIAGSLGLDVDRRGVVEALIEANGSDVLQPGQELVIPSALTRNS